MPSSSLWAIRDIKHGKTFYFDTFNDLVLWVSKMIGKGASNA